MTGKAAHGGRPERKVMMIQNAFELLSLSNEAALCTRGGLIQFANPAACALLGGDCVGRSLRDVFGEELSAVQAGGFIADCTLGARRCTARFTRIEKGYLIFLTPIGTDPSVLNDPLLFSLRSSLMDLGMVTDGLRLAAEERRDAGLLDTAASLARCYAKLTRQAENAGFVLGTLRGGNSFAAEPCDLGAICRTAAEAVAGFFPDLHIEAEVSCSGLVNASPTLFKLMLSNLLCNCLVHAKCEHVRLRLSETPQSILLSITDDGCGIPGEALQQAFDRYRYAFRPSELGGGPGLGLSVARGVAQLHGGTLLLESRPGFGTAVRVTVSRHLPAQLSLQEGGDALYSSRDLLIGLADCLPAEAFTEKYLD